MKKGFAFVYLIISLFCFKAHSQSFKVDTLYKTGSLDNRINVVILGDGFTEAELPKFTDEAKKFSDFLLAYRPYNRYKDYFNFFAIRTPSKESGVTNPGTAPDAYKDQPVEKKDNFYGSSFGTSIHRLVTISKYDVMTNVLATNLPSYDLVVILANTPWYGGSGGSVAVHTLHTQANTIGAHEIGHTFSYLNDEYWAGSIYGWEAPNMTSNSNPATIKWKNWLNTSHVGIFRHGAGDASLWFKPTNANCLMELLDKQLCNVCVEATTEKILQIVNPVKSVQPDTLQTVVLYQEDQNFSLDLLKPEPNSLQIEWRLDGNLIANGNDKINLSSTQLSNATGILTATVSDSTYLSRINEARTKRTRSVHWNLEKSNEPLVLKLISSADSICFGETIILSASGCLGDLSWSTGEVKKSITVKPDQTVEYTVSCKTNENNVRSASIKITVLSLPLATATNSGPYFEGATIQLNADGGSLYQWTGPENFVSQLQNPSIISSQTGNAGIYEVKVISEEGCSALARTEVKVDPILAVEPGNDKTVMISPNPAKDYLEIKTVLPGESVFVLYNINGYKMAEKFFTKRTSISLNNLSGGLYLYRLRNGEKEVSGKVMIQ